MGFGFCFLSIALFVSCLSPGNNAEAVYKYDNYLKNPPDIRVLLHDNIKEVQIEINQPYSILDFKIMECWLTEQIWSSQSYI